MPARSFFANLLDASEQAGMGVCIVVYSIDENDNQELLATLHTGEQERHNSLSGRAAARGTRG